MEVIKFHTGNLFKRKEFAETMRKYADVRAIAVEGGVLLDREAFNKVSPARMPSWGWVNKEYINSALHTTPATEEQKAAIRECYYVLMVGNSRVEKGSYKDMMISISKYADCLSHAAFRSLSIVDNVTGEVIYKTSDIEIKGE